MRFVCERFFFSSNSFHWSEHPTGSGCSVHIHRTVSNAKECHLFDASDRILRRTNFPLLYSDVLKNRQFKGNESIANVSLKLDNSYQKSAGRSKMFSLSISPYLRLSICASHCLSVALSLFYTCIIVYIRYSKRSRDCRVYMFIYTVYVCVYICSCLMYNT